MLEPRLSVISQITGRHLTESFRTAATIRNVSIGRFVSIFFIYIISVYTTCTEVSTGMYYYSTKMSHEGPTGDYPQRFTVSF
jgi:hypothetical protein